MDFEIGDTVQLKSGGPTMSVEQLGTRAYSDDPGVWCVWFEHVGNKQQVKRETFHPATLVKVESGGGGVTFGRVTR